jgi:chromosome partitioning protein
LPKGAKISFINFKGGVAKTTTAVNFAATLAKRGYSTLIVDLDPQCNTTQWLLGEKRGRQRIYDEPTLTVYQLFLDRIQKTHKFRFADSVVKAVAQNSRGLSLTPNLDLLPNTYRAIALEQELSAKGIATDEILKLQLEDIQYNYKFIVFDCPPNIYKIPLNALIFSNYFIIPVYPDYFADAGLFILCQQIDDNWTDIGHHSDDDLELLGIIITRIKERATLEPGKRVLLERRLKELKRDPNIKIKKIFAEAEVFEPYFNDSVEISRSIDEFIPTIYHYRSYSPIKEYIGRMNMFTDAVVKKVGKRFPGLKTP